MAGSSRRVRVLVADDHPLYREGLVREIAARPELEVVGTAADGREALAEVKRLEPDVAVLDVRMPELEGPRVLEALTRDRVETRVILLSAYVDSEVVYRAVAAGAGGYLSKEADAGQICDAISAVARGETVLAPEIQSALATEIQRHGQAGDRPVLSDREREILNLIAEGLSAPEIGAQLHLSPATVKTHLQSLYDKLGVSERAAAVAEAMRRGLLE